LCLIFLCFIFTSPGLCFSVMNSTSRCSITQLYKKECRTIMLMKLHFKCFHTMSRLALGPTQPPIQWVPGTLSLGVKQLECEADPSPPSSAEVKNAWSYTSTPPVHLHGVVLGQIFHSTVCEISENSELWKIC
jgi:hypothetical protein